MKDPKYIEATGAMKDPERPFRDRQDPSHKRRSPYREPFRTTSINPMYAVASSELHSYSMLYGPCDSIAPCLAWTPTSPNDIANARKLRIVELVPQRPAVERFAWNADKGWVPPEKI